MAKINGSDLLLYIDGSEVGLARSASLSDETATIDVTVKQNDGYADFIGGLQSATVDFEALANFSNENDIFDAWKNETQVSWVFSDGASASVGNLISGTGFITDLSITWGMEDVATFSGSITVNSAITIETVAPAP